MIRDPMDCDAEAGAANVPVPCPVNGRRWAIAHRGDSAAHVENTLASVAAAVHAGADVVEVDVQVTSDGFAVLHHDPGLYRVWRRREAVADLTFPELRAVVPAIPTVGEALAALTGTGVPLLLDLVSVAGARAAVRAVEQAGVRWDAAPQTAPVWFCGLPRALAWLRSEGVAAPRLLTWDRWMPVPEATVDAVAPAFFNPCHRLVTAALVRRWHDRGGLVSTWTVDSAARRRRLLGWGVDAVISNATRATVADVRSMPWTGGTARRAAAAVDVG